jgi:chitinase
LQYGSGSTDVFCSSGCQSDYGICKGVDVLASWRKAQKDGLTDQVAGGQYYWDSDANLFWTWDTPTLILRKFSEIVVEKQLGGVMAWSLGEDTYDWSHLNAMEQGVSYCKCR